MKQILLITDGCSNVGISPEMAAAHARGQGITVNVIGVVDGGLIGEHGAEEIAETAQAGGGMSKIVAPSMLSQTVQMLTRKTVISTLQQVVNQELRHILGPEQGELTELSPERRGEVVHLVEELSESASLQIALLVDTSASMKPKLGAVEEAIRDLMLSLQARQGISEVAVFHFPGPAGQDDAACQLTSWSRDVSALPRLFGRLKMKGNTPTGPALLHVVEAIASAGGTAKQLREPVRTARVIQSPRKEGMFGEYLV
ncbi:hypothetical protein [Paenibacillus sp. y28]|uniref:hypothetical protein n=1 Tax=Paenibacillus sp. y28 TaxID=3129110 RepID=UPI00301B13BB